MKKSDLKRQLKKELHDAAPSDFESLWKICRAERPADSPMIQNSREQKDSAAETTPMRPAETAPMRPAHPQTSSRRPAFFRRRSVQLVSCALALAILLTGGLAILFGKHIGLPLPSPDSPAGGYLLIDINPSLELNYGADGSIISAKGLNRDGEALLLELDLIGKSGAEASELLFTACVNLGYFSAGRQNNAMLVSAVSEDGKKDSEMTAMFKDEFSRNFVKNKMYGAVITGVTNSVLETEAKKYGIDGQKMGLIRQYQILGGELDESEFEQITVRELYELISIKEKENREKLIEELNEDLTDAKQDLMENIREKLQDVIEGLSSSVEDLLESGNDALQDAYEEKIEALEQHLELLEDETNEESFRLHIQALLKDLEQMESEESEPLLKETMQAAADSITALNRRFDEMFKELEKQTADALETYENRKKKYGSHPSTGKDSEDEIERWQEEQEDLLESDWYSIKSQWDLERDSDLDDD